MLGLPRDVVAASMLAGLLEVVVLGWPEVLALPTDVVAASMLAGLLEVVVLG